MLNTMCFMNVLKCNKSPEMWCKTLQALSRVSDARAYSLEAWAGADAGGQGHVTSWEWQGDGNVASPLPGRSGEQPRLCDGSAARMKMGFVQERHGSSL